MTTILTTPEVAALGGGAVLFGKFHADVGGSGSVAGRAMTFYHFTCAHVAHKLGRHAILRPPTGQHPIHPTFPRVLWLTDMARVTTQEDKDSLGLTSEIITCDRTKYRYAVSGKEADKIIPWLGSDARARLSPDLLKDLEYYGNPTHWFITFESVRAHRL